MSSGERDRRWGLWGGGKVFLGWKGDTVRVEEMGVKREVYRQERLFSAADQN